MEEDQFRKKKTMTVQEFKEITGVDYSDEEAEEIMRSLTQLSQILIAFALKNGIISKSADDPAEA